MLDGRYNGRSSRYKYREHGSTKDDLRLGKVNGSPSGDKSNSQVETYAIDGLRIDAAKSIPYPYAQLMNNVTDSYAIGEVFDGDAGYACRYQSSGLDAFLNFPVYYQVVTLKKLKTNCR